MDHSAPENFNTGDPSKIIKIKDTGAKSLSETRKALESAKTDLEKVHMYQLSGEHYDRLARVNSALKDALNYFDHVEAVLQVLWCTTDRGQLEHDYNELESEILRKG